MLNNYVTIGLAIISLVCVYLIWENFKQSAKIRYLEASIHETIQTVQGLVNNSLSLPPLPRNENHNYHPTPINNSMSSVQNNNNKNNSNNFNNNNSNNVNINSSNVEPRNTNVEKELFENDLESVTDEVENDVATLEPLELTNELKDKINNLVFVDGEESTDNESNHESEEDEEDEENEMKDDLNNLEYDDEEKEKQPSSPVEIEELEDFSNEIQMENIDVQPEQKTYKKQENQEDVKDEENIFDDHLSHLEEVKETQKESTSTEDYIKNPELLNGMSLKQLKDIAEKYNLGVRGGKEQLLTKIKRNITMLS